MMTRRIVPSLVALAVVPAAAIAWQQSKSQGPREVQRESVSAVLGSDAELRARGPEGLRAILAQYDRTKDPALLSRIDAVAGQRDAVWSRLYWYTDWKQANAAARAENKPILYLRLLGKLTDEYSCANSRFFRTVLYANESVSKVLREKFILVWDSERPVPVVTIDYGDGRTLKRTVTGNSIHYVVSPQGDVVDALPGLYDPATFVGVLNAAAETATSNFSVSPLSYWVNAKFILEEQMEHDLQRLGLAGAGVPMLSPTRGNPTAAEAGEVAEAKRRVEQKIVGPTRAEPAPAVPDAVDASKRAFGKTAVERPLVMASAPAGAAETATDTEVWARLGALHAGAVQLDANSMALMRSHNPAYADPAVFARAMERLRLAIAQDTARNQYDLRTKILDWLSEKPGLGVDPLNTRVYSELFLTPRSDPWLGLKSDDVYSALPNDGCVAK